MIIGEFDNSNFDNYEEDTYDYLFKRKPKAGREEKRLTRKEGRGLKKPRLIPGKRKLPLVGNFGMFDKNKRKNKNASANTIQVGVNSTDMNANETPSTPVEMDATPVSSSAPPELGAISAAPSSSPTAPVSTGASADSSEIKVPASAINSAVALNSDKAKVAEKADSPASVDAKNQTKSEAKKSNVKEAGFSSMLGFAFMGIALILAGYAIFKADQKSRKELNPLKAAA